MSVWNKPENQDNHFVHWYDDSKMILHTDNNRFERKCIKRI